MIISKDSTTKLITSGENIAIYMMFTSKNIPIEGHW